MKAKNVLASLTIALLCLAETVARASPLDGGAEKSQIDGQLTADYPHLEALYRSIHSHPELGFQEVRTAALLAQEMRKLGFQVTEKVGRTGIVAIYRNGPGPTVILLSRSPGDLPWSVRPGLRVGHCGGWLPIGC